MANTSLSTCQAVTTRSPKPNPPLFSDGAENLGTTGGTLTGPDSFTTVSLAAGEHAVGYLFGELSPSVAGSVYVDANSNGTRDPGEVGIPGVAVRITGPGAVDMTVTTDLNGDYLFASVPTGSGYTLTQTQPPGYGSLEAPVNTITALNVPLSGVTNQNFGEVLGSIGGRVYIDANNNGVQDGTEPGIGGATINVSGLNAGGQSVNITVTSAANGDYLVEGLLQGTYMVSEFQPTGYEDGKDAIGTVTAGASGAQDGFELPDRIVDVVLAINDDGVNYNFGEIGTSIAGTVFRDKAKNGTFEPGTDAPLAGQTVELFDSTGTVLLATETTAADGSYFFPYLKIGTYVVKETQPAGYANTVGVAGPNTRTVVAPAGGIGGLDFGETLASIGGSVWLDLDRDGVRDFVQPDGLDAIDPAIPGITITLSDTNPSTPDVVMVTDANGEYFFDNLAPDTYTVTESQPIANGDGADLPGSLGGTAAVNDVISNIVVVAGAVGASYDFAEVAAKVSGIVWLDSDLDGTVDGSETTRLANVEITLDDGDPLTTDPTAMTNAVGYYEFLAVPVGNYTIVETQPSGYASTSPASNQIAVEVAKDGLGVIADLADNNFGEALGGIGDRVWNDLDGDGVQDASEPGIPGVTVTITATIGGSALCPSSMSQTQLVPTDSPTCHSESGQ